MNWRVSEIEKKFERVFLGPKWGYDTSDARRPQGHGRASFNNPFPRFCTFYNRYNHTIECCYHKHGFPNKPNSQANANYQANAILVETYDVSNVSSSIGLA